MSDSGKVGCVVNADRARDKKIKELERTRPKWRQGEVTSTSPLEVSIGGGTPVSAKLVAGVSLTIGDQVQVLQRGSDLLVLGVPSGTVSAGYQPLDSDLTAIAALSTTSFGRALLELANAGAGRSALGLVIGTDVQAYDSDLASIAALSTTSFGRSLLTQANAADARSTIGAAASSHTHAQSDITSLVSDLAAKAAKAGETYSGTHNFTGATINVPTAAPGDADNSAASTAFVEQEVGLAAAGFTVKPQADYATVQALDSYTGTGTGTLEASVNGTLLTALGLENERWDYSLTFLAIGTPYAIARDSSGYLYVTYDILGQYRVGKFDPSGNTVASFSGSPYFGTNGTGNGQFGDVCHGIAVDSSGNIYVADSANKRIQKFNSSGVYQAQVGAAGTGNGQFGASGPRGICLDSSSNLFVTDPQNNRVQKFNSSLVYQSQFGSSGTGNGQFDNPNGIAVDSSNNIFVADSFNERIQKFTSGGSYSSQFGSSGSGNGQFGIPLGVAIDSSDNIFVSDLSLNRIQKFNSSGTYVAKFGSTGTLHGQLVEPRGIVVDSSGNIYACDNANSRVEKLVYAAAAPVAVNQSVLVKDQAFGGGHVDHGVYRIDATGGVSAKWRLVRRDDMDTSAEVPSGLLVNVRQRGPIIPGGMWYVPNADPITVGTTALIWEQFLPGGYPTAHAASHGPDGDDPIPGVMPNLGTLFRTEAAMDFTSSTATANQAYYGRIVVPTGATISGIYYRVGATSSGNVTAALYDSSGTRLANRATGTAQATAAFGQAIAFDSAVTLEPGVYAICLVFSSGTATFRSAFTFGANNTAGPGAGATPTSITFPAAAGLSSIPVMATY